MHQPSRRRRHHRLLALMLPLGLEAERLFDPDLDGDIYAPFDDELVIVADEVVREPAAAAGDSTTTSGG